MRRALLVGIDGYPSAPLSGCVADAQAISNLLSTNEDGSPNFECRRLLSSDSEVTRPALRQAMQQLFSNEADLTVLYFAGHGLLEDDVAYLVTQDAASYDAGLEMNEVLRMANSSKANEVVVILDCCHSGAFGNVPHIQGEHAGLRRGVSVLAASGRGQTADEVAGRGVFTSLVCDALSGGAADVLGSVTVAGVYAYVDQLLGSWDQRPGLKAHVSRLAVIRKCGPQVSLSLLRRLPDYFLTADMELPLDPSYEPDACPEDADHESIFGDLQRLRAARLLTPVGEEHMYYAAMNSKGCCLTPLGQFYWRMAKQQRI